MSGRRFGRLLVSASRQLMKSEKIAARVLVAEDEAINRMYIVSLLEDRGYSCVGAKNGLEAVDVFRRQRVEVVLMDLGMPVMDGLAAVREIRRLERATSSRATVIALTAHGDKRDRANFQEVGVDAFLLKPFSEEDLVEVVATAARFLDTPRET